MELAEVLGRYLRARPYWFGDGPVLAAALLRLLRAGRKRAACSALAASADEALTGWRAGHERYYRRKGIFDPQMALIWERPGIVRELGAVDELG